MDNATVTTLIGLGFAAFAFVGTMFGTIWLTRRRLAPPLVSSALIALAVASPPWILRSVGAYWSVEFGLLFSAIVGTLVFAGTLRPFRRLYEDEPSRDIHQR